MSTTNRPACPTSRPAQPAASHRSVSADRPTAAFPTGWRGCPSAYVAAGDPRLVEADATPTAVFPVHPLAHPLAQPRQAFPEVEPEQVEVEVEHEHEHEGGRPTARRERLARRAAHRRAAHRQALRRHLHRALAAIALAAAILGGLQLYAASGITAARQAALAARNEGGATAPASTSASPQPATSTMSGQKVAWVTQDTHVPYSKDDAAATPLDLPRCTTAPDTPMPCLAHLHTSPSGAPDRVVTLEEDGSMTAFVPR